jgi:HPt (histidine-containing phosphotransfer) domain-containing protein
VVHVLVSAAGNIGASRLQHAAQSLEVALRQAHVAHILATRPRFEAEWHDAINAVQATLERLLEGSQPPACDGAATLGRDHVNQLRKLIDEHDTAAVELVDLLRESLVTDSLAQLTLQRLAQSVTSYDFETAQQHLDSLSSQLKWNDDMASDPIESL